MSYIENNYHCELCFGTYSRSHSDMFDPPRYSRPIQIQSGGGGNQYISYDRHYHHHGHYGHYYNHASLPSRNSIIITSGRVNDAPDGFVNLKVTDRTENRRSQSRPALYDIQVPMNYPAIEIIKDLITDTQLYKVSMLNTHDLVEDITPDMHGLDYTPHAKSLMIQRKATPPRLPETFVVRPLERRIGF